jgi:hypothetical protein
MISSILTVIERHRPDPHEHNGLPVKCTGREAADQYLIGVKFGGTSFEGGDVGRSVYLPKGSARGYPELDAVMGHGSSAL